MIRVPCDRTLVLALAIPIALWPGSAGAAPIEGWQAKVDPSLLAESSGIEPDEFLVVLEEQADLSAARALRGQRAKGRAVVAELRATAERSQAALRGLLHARGVEHRPLWVANVIWLAPDAGSKAALIQELAQRSDVRRIAANPRVRMEMPRLEESSASGAATTGPEWGLQQIGAPLVWGSGIDGAGIVIGGQDTGYDWTHPALRDRYRGWDGSAAQHDYNWHDAIHTTGVNTCGANAPAPCDDGNHGTHTMGTMVGQDGDNQIGVAPGARWIGCRNMDNGAGTPATYAECFQWFLAPTKVAGGQPRPDLAPQVINNSWGCTPSEGCTDAEVLRTVVENARAAGIVVVVSAGNDGPGCGSVSNPAAIYDSSFTVGATGPDDVARAFSSRGPVTVDGSNRLKPDVMAPGTGIRSSVPGGGYVASSGTSMASPHVAGLVALLLQARPEFDGDVERIEQVIRDTAVPLSTTEDCGGTAGLIPNATYGHGRVDAWQAATTAGGDASFRDEFEDGERSSGWNFRGKTWRELQGALAATGGEAWAQRAFAGCSACSVEARLTIGGGRGGDIALVGWRGGNQHWVQLRLAETENRWILVQKSGARTKQAKVAASLAADTAYDVRVSFDGEQFDVSINGVHILTMAKLAGSSPSGTVGFRVTRRSARFDYIAVD